MDGASRSSHLRRDSRDFVKSHILLPLFTAALAWGDTARATPSDPRPDLDGATYAVRMRNIQTAVDEEKERTRRNRIRLSLLSDSVSGVHGSAIGEISLHDDVTSDVILVRAVVHLAGVGQYDK